MKPLGAVILTHKLWLNSQGTGGGCKADLSNKNLMNALLNRSNLERVNFEGSTLANF